jgi:hypothetical protein
MEKILAKRYAFCDFSDIAGFPHPVPTINEWGDYLPRFRGSKYDHPGEHLFNFHECMLEHGFVHEDVLIKLFKFSLEGNAREWCQSLPAVSIHSLKDFHVAFNSYYEKIYPADLLFPECCLEEEIVPVENLKSEEGSLQFPDLQGLSDLQLKHESLDPNNREDPNPGVESAADVNGSPHLPDLQKKTDLKQSTFRNEFCGENEEQLQHNRVEQQLPEVFHTDFEDPFADFLEAMSSIVLKNFLPEEDYLYPLFKPFFCMIWLLLLIKSKSSMLPVDKFLTWLHWKHEFT